MAPRRWGMVALLMNPSGNAAFQPTRWSLVAVAATSSTPQARAAMETLCHSYWYPLYAYIRSKGHSPEDAQDLTQGFFARIIEKDLFGGAAREKGKLRTFLLNACQNFLINEWRKAQSLSRGGGEMPLSIDAEAAEGWYANEPAHQLTPEALYHRSWALALLEQGMAKLRAEYSAGGRTALFEALKSQLENDADHGQRRDLAAGLGMTEGALRVAVYRLRQRHRAILFEQVAQSLGNASEEEVKQELQQLIAALS